LHVVDGFTKKYEVDRLVYYEVYDDIKEAIHWETCVKRWNRDWKIRRIEENNPDWNDLYVGLLQ